MHSLISCCSGFICPWPGNSLGRVGAELRRPFAENIRGHRCHAVWALLASGQINMRKIDGGQMLATKPIDQPIDLAA